MIAIFLATFGLVFLRAIQQQNITARNYALAAITPFAIAVAEVASVLYVVAIGWPAVPVVGAGGACGVVLAMYVYRRGK